MCTSFLWCYIGILLRKLHLRIKPMTCHCRLSPNLWRHEWGQQQTLQATRDYFTHCCILWVSQPAGVTTWNNKRMLTSSTWFHHHRLSVCWSSGWTCPCAYLWQFITSFLSFVSVSSPSVHRNSSTRSCGHGNAQVSAKSSLWGLTFVTSTCLQERMLSPWTCWCMFMPAGPGGVIFTSQNRVNHVSAWQHLRWSDRRVHKLPLRSVHLSHIKKLTISESWPKNSQ